MSDTHQAAPTDQQAPTAKPLARPARRHREILSRLKRKWSVWREEELRAHPVFWIAFALLLALAAALRIFHVDMPPFDFPADRQRTNASMIELFRQGGSIAAERYSWLELWILPWITARTSWLRHLFGGEIWTLARLWSVFFGLVTVAMAPWAGYWAAASPGAPEARRRRIALLWMAALALNPYHRTLSRMISTESVTLAMQMCAVAFFWAAWRSPRPTRNFVIFIVFFVMAGWAKIPSLIWLPAFFICYLFHPATRPRTRLVGLAGVGLGVLIVFWTAKIDPLSAYESYANKYSYFAAQMRLWMGNELWTKTYVSRTVLMLTLPGAFFALIGLMSAPWLFRIAMATFLLLFYCLVNLNIYNFAHAIIPGMALAAWGMNSMIEAATNSITITSTKARLTHTQFALTRVGGYASGAAFIAAIVFFLYPLGPKDPQESVPRGEVLQGANVIRQLTPQGAIVANDDTEGSLNYMIGQWVALGEQTLNLRSGYFYSINRFSEKAVQYAASAWVRWASIPGEPGGLLFTRQPAQIPASELGQYIRVAKAKGAPLLPFDIVAFQLPRKNYDQYRRILTVHPGSAVKIGITWKNDAGSPLAGIRWSSALWRRYVPVPVREGGMAVSFGGVLCLPKGANQAACYTFEIPQEMPGGTYAANFYAQDEGRWRSPNEGFQSFPFNIVVENEAAAQGKVERDYRSLYGTEYSSPPFVWSEHWFYKNMRLEGYRTNTGQINLLSCPLSQPGVYELAIEGEADPTTSPSAPEDRWPEVEVYAPQSKGIPAARLPISSRQTGWFKTTFTAYEPFDSLLLKAKCESGGGNAAPLWMCHFLPAVYGRQTVTLRKVRLELKRAILPGLGGVKPTAGGGAAASEKKGKS